MELIFIHVTTPDIHIGSGWNGTQIPCKQRTGQRPLSLTKEFTITLPDKVDAKWYSLLTGKLAGYKLAGFKHDIKVFDSTPLLTEGYKRLMQEPGRGLNYNLLKVDPTTLNFVNRLGRGIIALKEQAKQKLNGF